MGVPPLALTRIRGACGLGENRITPSGPHVPPRPSATSQTANGEPLLRSIVFSFVSAKNPSERLSGDQKGKIAFSVPGITRASSTFMGRTPSAVFPSAPVAANAMDVPSGDSTGGPAVSPVRLSVDFSGGLMTVRVDGAGGLGRLKKTPASTPSAMAATSATAQPLSLIHI